MLGLVFFAAGVSACHAASRAAGEVPGWMQTGSAPESYSFTQDSLVIHGGSGAAHVKARTRDVDGFGTLMQIVDGDPYRGQRLRLSAFVRAVGVSHFAGLWMRVDGRARRILAFDNMQSRPVKGTVDWARYQVVLDVAPEAVDVAFGALLEGGGEIWIDDVALDVVDASVPVTGSYGDGWIVAGSMPADYDMGSDSMPVRLGARETSYLRSKVASPQGFGSWARQELADDDRGQRVRLSGWVEATAVEGWAGLWLSINGGPDNKTLAFDNMSSRAIRGTVAWTRYEVVMDVPDEAVYFSYGTLLAGAGALRMADVTLDVVGPSSAVAEEPLADGFRLTGSAADAYDFDGDPTAGRSGAAHLRSKVADPAGFGALVRAVDASPYRGGKAKLTALVKADDVRGWAGLWMRVDDARKQPVAFDNMQSRPLRGSAGFTRHEVVLEVPEGATRIAFGALVSGAGGIEVAELALGPTAPSAEPTDLTRKRPEPQPRPSNLAFEE
jgi:hypothetical protein